MECFSTIEIFPATNWCNFVSFEVKVFKVVEIWLSELYVQWKKPSVVAIVLKEVEIHIMKCSSNIYNPKFCHKKKLFSTVYLKNKKS